MLYSYKNSYPKEIPYRIRLSDGRTRTDPSTFTEEEILDAGYVQVDDPPSVGEYQALSWDGLKWVLRDFNEQEILDYQARENQKLIDYFVTETQNRLDNFAKTRNYDGILSACTYASDSNPKFASEGQYCVTARSATWSKLYEILTDVKAGVRQVPINFTELEQELPQLIWPI